MKIRLASDDDVPAVAALESRYFVGNLSAIEQQDGFISILHGPQWFGAAVDAMGLHVAVTDDEDVVGFMAVTPPTKVDAAIPPIMVEMMALAEQLEFNGALIAKQRFAFRGPVLIDKAARGNGLYARFNAAMHQTYASRYDLAVLFVAADNPKSLHTTTTKLGAKVLAQFEADAKRYHFLAFQL